MSQSIKVLIVDDEDLIRLNLRALLEDLGYEVVEAANGQEGLETFVRERPDLVLADLRMPVLDGLAMIAGLQEKSPETPVIVVSGTGAVRDAVNSVRLGAWDYIIKPVEDVEDFAIIITRALERAQLIRDNRRYREHLEDLVRERTTELRESETRYRRLLESVTSYVYTVTVTDGRPDATVHGPGCEAVTGFTPEEYAADPDLWRRMVHDDDRSRVVAMAQRILDERLPIAFEHRLSHKDGTIRWVHNTLVPHHTARGELLSYDGIVVDITARKRAEETLRENERLLAEIAANYPNSYLSIVEKDLTIGFTSGQEFKKQHLDPRSFIGLSLEQVFGEQAPIVREYYLKTFQGEETSFELFIHNQHQLYNVVPLYDHNGHVTRILAVVENITARKQAERELQRSNDLLRAIIEAAPTAIIGLDLDGNVQIVWNPAAEKMLGWSAQEAMGHFLPSVPVESQEEFRRFREWIRSGQPLDGVEVRRQRRDGSPIDYSIYASPLHDAEGQITGNVAVLVDITERKRAEAEINKLTRAVEQSPAAIVITDTAGNIEYVNPRFTQISGYTSAEVLGQNPRFLKSGETPPEEYQRLWEIITHGDVWRGEFHNKKKSGDLYWESASISPVIDAQGSITHFVAVKEDITARKQTEEDLRILNEELELRVRHRTAELEAANKELQEFAHIVSHDLKAPLRGINRLTQWLREDYAGMLDAQGQEHLDLLGQQVKRMDTMIDGILRYSRVGHGGERKESIALNTLVAQVIEMLMLPAHITIQCENTLPVIHGDPIQLMQVFQNLLSNAVKFLDKPIGKITVASEDADEEWIFQVQDNGPGIEARHHDRIFKIFQSCTTRDDRENTGIGLAVVKKIVELYGGRVWVESTPGHGSRFSFSWPKRTGEKD